MTASQEPHTLTVECLKTLVNDGEPWAQLRQQGPCLQRRDVARLHEGESPIHLDSPCSALAAALRQCHRGCKLAVNCVPRADVW